MKKFNQVFVGLLALSAVGCGGGGGGATTGGPFAMVVGNSNRISIFRINTGGLTGLVEGAAGPNHFRISPDGTKFLVTQSGELLLGDTATGLATPITGYKYGDWYANGTRIAAIRNDNIVVTLTGTGSALEPLFNASAGGGASGIDCDDANDKIYLTYAPSGWSQVASIPEIGGTKFAAVVGSGIGQDIEIMNSDGTGLTTIANTTEAETDPVFLSNTVILYTRSLSSGTATAIYSMTTAGGSQSLYISDTQNLMLGDIFTQ
jgi:hypothetical protein